MKKILTACFALLIYHAVYAIEEEALLDPNDAFAFSAQIIDPQTIEVQFTIADGYFLYRNNFRFSSNSEAVTITNVDYPQGKIKQDEFFGEVEIYRRSVSIPLTLNIAADVEEFDLITVSQGCADVGVCYPPQTASMRFVTPLNTEFSTLRENHFLDQLNKQLQFGFEEPELLPPEQAFEYQFFIVDRDNLLASFRIAEGYYLYKDQLKFSLLNEIGYRIERVLLPVGKLQDDELWGRVEVYTGDIEIPIKLQREDENATDFELVTEYQGCAEIGVCYPPVRKEAVVQMDRLEIQNTQLDATDITVGTTAEKTKLSEQDALAQRLRDGSILTSILLFFIAGIGLAFTPCVFPMIPILSGIIVGQGKSISTRKAFMLSVFYVGAMAVVFSIAGVVAALLGANLQILFQNPLLLSIFAALFVVLALSMFGFYELQMPSWIQSKLTKWSNHQRSGSYIGAAITGMLSALIVGPCVTPPLIAALIYISQSQDPWLGGLALFSLAVGMGLPLVAVGTFTGKLLPRVGVWMDSVRAVFGVMMLALAIWMLERFLPASVILVLTGLLLLVSGIYMGAFEPIGKNQSGWIKLWKGMGLAAILYGAVLLVGAASGSKSLLTPLANIGGAASEATVSADKLDFRYVKSISELQQALQQAQQNGQFAMLDFYADWCISCKEMEAFTFSDEQVQAKLSGMLLLKADVTANDTLDQDLLKKFSLFGPPAILFFSPEAGELRAFRVVGSKSADQFLSHLNELLL